MSLNILRFLAVGLCLTTAIAPACADTPAALHEKAASLKLADSPYWRLLLRYEPGNTPSGWISEARSANFFLAPKGQESPDQELHALLNALYASAGNADEAAACRFPARTAWVQEQLEFTAPAIECTTLRTWKQAINPAQVTLVFASDYLNNPSSMFGHTFLRLDAPEQTEHTRLLAYAVNYAANVTTSNPFSFAWNGLAGGYPGVFSLMPYYDKVKEYSDMENRDLWEYQLAFTPAELQRLLDHLWELRRVEFPYYFLTRNCSYQLLSLFEAARPGLQLRSAFPVQAIPTDTVRRLLEEPGLLRKLVYRPAAERRLLHDASDNSRAVNQAALALTRQPDLATGLTPPEEAAALEVAYDYRYYHFLTGDQSAGAKQDLRRLLVRRAELQEPSQRSAPPQPAVDPAGGHPTARLALSVGQAREAAYAALHLRPAYHDLLDPPQGYRRGAHIGFLDSELRLDDERQTLRLERLAIIDIESLTGWDEFFRPWSWFFNTGYRQAAVDREGRFSEVTSHGVAFADTGAGASLDFGKQLGCSLLLAAAAEAGPALDNGWRAGAGPRAGCLYGFSRGRVRAQVDSRYYNDSEKLENRGSLEAHVDIDSHNGLRLQLGVLHSDNRSQGFGEAAWMHYF
jgi:hypothetical protein